MPIKRKGGHLWHRVRSGGRLVWRKVKRDGPTHRRLKGRKKFHAKRPVSKRPTGRSTYRRTAKRTAKRTVRRGKSKVRIVAKRRGELTKYGYHLAASPSTRRSALRKAVRAYGLTPVKRKINALRVWNKNKPGKRRTADADYRFLSKL